MITGKISRLQHLRAYAALLVVVDHAILHSTTWLENKKQLASIAYFLGDLGVWVFFVISGFLMMHISGNQFGVAGSWRKFVVQRLARIVPLYWLATILYGLKEGNFNPEAILKSLLFIPYKAEVGATAPILGQGWTLNFEILFYLLFACSLLLPLRKGLIFLFFSLTAMAIIHPVISVDLTPLYEWSRPIILLFLVGIGLAVAFKRWPDFRTAGGWKSVAGWGGLAVSFSFAVFFAGNAASFSSVLSAILSIVIVAAFLFLKREGEPTGLGGLIERAGDASYSTYLTHGLVVGGVFKGWSHVVDGAPFLFIIAVIALSLLFGQLVHIYIERPLTNLFKPARLPAVRTFTSS